MVVPKWISIEEKERDKGNTLGGNHRLIIDDADGKRNESPTPARTRNAKTHHTYRENYLLSYFVSALFIGGQNTGLFISTRTGHSQDSVREKMKRLLIVLRTVLFTSWWDGFKIEGTVFMGSMKNEQKLEHKL